MKLRYKVITGIFCLLLFGGITSFASAEDSTSIYIDGVKQSFDPPAMIVQDRTLVPLRAIFESLGATVNWDQATETVTAIKGDTIVKLQIGSKDAFVNGNLVALDVPAQTVRDRTMVPARFVSESLGAVVEWDEEYNSVYIRQNKDLQGLYISPEGIRYESESKSWDTGNLRRLDNFFQHNIRGSELQYLSTIRLETEAPVGKLGEIEIKWAEQNGQPVDVEKGRVIHLYHADEITDPAQMTFTLSHEYGHLFTYVWLIKKEHKLPEDPTTGWAKLRSLNSFPLLWNFTVGTQYWKAEEVLADEYAELFGAPEGKIAQDSFSDSQMIMSIAYRIKNKTIPAAEGVKGLRNYWENLAGVSSHLPEMVTPAIQNMSIDYTEWQPRIKLELIPWTTNTKYQYWSIYTVPKPDKSAEEVVSEPSSSINFYLGGEVPYLKGSYYILPHGVGLIQVFAQDKETKQVTYSQEYWYDMTDFTNIKATIRPKDIYTGP